MDEYDFREIDAEESPPEFEWIPVGEYNGIDLPGTYVDESYIVWLEIRCPDYGE